jgi:hypothetical protein
MVAVPVTVSMTLDERDHLDAWARAHDMTRSAAIRSVIRQLRWPGQERLDSFSGSPPPKAFAELVEASEEASRARQADTQPPEQAADDRPSMMRQPCFGQPSALLNGRCIGGHDHRDKDGNLVSRNVAPHAPACPACWPPGTTAWDTRQVAREALRQEREAQSVMDARALYDALNAEE